MIAARKIECFALSNDERFAFVGNVSGQILTVDVETFSISSEKQAHVGGVYAIATHPTQPFIATLSQDRRIGLMRVNADGTLSTLATVSNRALDVENDDETVRDVQSQSQSLGFHPSELRLVTRSGSAAVLELAFTENGDVEIVRCRRMHEDRDLYATRYTIDGSMVLSGSTRGDAVLSMDGRVLRTWQLGHSSVHWFEHLHDTQYLVASDMRYVAKIDISSDDFIHGPRFTRDDLEHVTYNKRSGRAFAASFDRNVWEVDPKTCEPMGSVYQAPFKLRWIKTLESQPDLLIAQVRNGSLVKFDLQTSRELAIIRETPDAIWSMAVRPSGEMVFAGEGEHAIVVTPGRFDPVSRTDAFDAVVEKFEASPSYSKRIDYHVPSGLIFAGRASGEIVRIGNGSSDVACNLGSAIRDLAAHPVRNVVYVALEDGRVAMIDAQSSELLGERMSSSGLPVWALAYNPTRDTLAFGDRSGLVEFVDGTSLEISGGQVALEGRMKRLKWIGVDSVAGSSSDSLCVIDVADGSMRTLVDGLGNTVEDFIIDVSLNYLVLISYTCNVTLIDLENGDVLHSIADQMDYSKGIAWLPSSNVDGYPRDFITFGRSGVAHRFRIHDEKILALGPLFNPVAARSETPAFRGGLQRAGAVK